MALVAYSDESDISDREEEVKEISTKEISNKTSNDKAAVNENTIKGNVSSLKIPDETSNDLYLDQDENDIVNDVPTVQTWNVIKTKDTSLNIGKVFKKDPKSKKIKLVLPALSEFNDDDDEDEDAAEMEAKRKKIQPSSCGTGLFAVLPKPRASTITSLVPLNVSKKNVNKNKIKQQKSKKILPKELNDSDDEWTANSSNDFFSLEESHSVSIAEPKIETEIIIRPRLDVSQNVSTANTPEEAVHVGSSKEQTFGNQLGFSDNDNFGSSKEQTLGNQLVISDNDNFAVPSSNKSELDIQALRQLAGRRNLGEIPNIIDIKADDALMSREEWVTRTLCEEKPKKSYSKKREGNPTQTQKRKHQITYLAHQAQEREHELRNTWEQNRFTKMQTQSRYGF